MTIDPNTLSLMKSVGIGLGWSLLATLLAWLLLRAMLYGRRWLRLRVQSALRERKGSLSHYIDFARSSLQFLGDVLLWGLCFLLVDVWMTFVLEQFDATRAWGERSTAWMVETLSHLASSVAAALPGLVVAVLIFTLARLVSRANSAFLNRVQRGEASVGWLDMDTVTPTRRISNVAIWLFALAMAYPYLPGANSDAFRGVSVLVGLMLSLGGSGVIGQVMAGMSLMYSRSLRVGEYVRIGDTEGTVTQLGVFATKLHTGLGEEVSLPNSVVFGQPVRNFSRLVQDGRFVLQTTVTIGYATPWRQVHAMLLEAAHRTPGVAPEPAPYVVQTALSDFYVEYRLCAQSNRAAPDSRAEAMSHLNANVQDVFNENSVQIMSPHYMTDPPSPQVVAPDAAWAARQPQPPLKPVP